jgi:hypothetical protein
MSIEKAWGRREEGILTVYIIVMNRKGGRITPVNNPCLVAYIPLCCKTYGRDLRTERPT